MWIADIRTRGFDDYVSLDVLSKCEKIVADKYISKVAKMEFIGGRVMTRLVFSHYTSTPASDIVVKQFPGRKPVLETPSDNKFFFNISHCYPYVIVGFSNIDEIGVDIEFIDPNVDICAITARFFNEVDKEYLSKFPNDHKLVKFYELWVSKESCIKTVGYGLDYGMNNVNRINDNSWMIDGKIIAVNVNELRELNGYLTSFACLSELPNVAPRLRKFPNDLILGKYG